MLASCSRMFGFVPSGSALVVARMYCKVGGGEHVTFHIPLSSAAISRVPLIYSGPSSHFATFSRIDLYGAVSKANTQLDAGYIKCRTGTGGNPTFTTSIESASSSCEVVEGE